MIATNGFFFLEEMIADVTGFRFLTNITNILQIVFATIDAILVVGRLSRQKKDILFNVISSVVLIAISYILCTFAINLPRDSSFAPILMVFSMIVPGSIFIVVFNDSQWSQRIMKMLLFFSSVYVATEIAHHVNLLSAGVSSDALRDFYMILPHLLMIISGVLISFFNISRFTSIPNLYLFLSGFVFVLLFSVTFAQSKLFLDPANNYYDIIMIFILLAFLGIDITIYIVTYSLIQKEKEVREAQAEAKINESASYMLKLNEESIVRSTEIRHDLKNHFAYISALLKEGNYDKALSYSTSLQENAYSDINIVDCGNSLISSIMNLEISKARMENVKIKYIIAVPSQLPFLDIDLCPLLTNLIDNAIEELARCEHTDEDYVDVRLKYEQEYLRFIVVNKTNKKNVNFKTEKEGNHGYGSKIVGRIVNKYNGYITYVIKDGQFIADGILNISEKQEKTQNANDRVA